MGVGPASAGLNHSLSPFSVKKLAAAVLFNRCSYLIIISEGSIHYTGRQRETRVKLEKLAGEPASFHRKVSYCLIVFLKILSFHSKSHFNPKPPYIHNSKYDYLNWEAYSQHHLLQQGFCHQSLRTAPHQWGAKGKMKLPDPKVLVEEVHVKRNGISGWNPQGTNLMVDAGHIYGDSLDRQLDLRLHKDGKLKYQVVSGEIYPPTVLDAQVKMSYPPSVPPEMQLAIGQEVFGLLPGLSMYATLWLREHNRVCDILKKEHPTWGDEQLFQTARLIIIGKDFLRFF
ncbi:prostaglandin G/H synthase [Pimephales promelas]|nr:prostaglandin G/H synthase [Pimephales promelas]